MNDEEGIDKGLFTNLFTVSGKEGIYRGLFTKRLRQESLERVPFTKN